MGRKGVSKRALIQRPVVAGVLTVVLIGMVGLVLALAGVFVPKSLLDDGVDRYSGAERDFASYALNQSYFHFDNFFEKLLRMRLRVVSVERIGEGRCEIYTPDHPDPFYLEAEYVAQVGEYTFFAVPIRSVDIHCLGQYYSPD